MSELKITVDQLKNYLGTGLMLEYSGFGEDKKSIVDEWSISIQEHHDIHFIHSDYGFDDDVLFYFKPICYRLSDLDKEIEHNGERFVPLYELIREFNFHKDDIDTFGLHTIPFGATQDLLKWHFWPFGDEYFEQDLVIDKRKILKNNSKNT